MVHALFFWSSKCNSIFETLGPYKPAKAGPRHQVRDAAYPPPPAHFGDSKPRIPRLLALSCCCRYHCWRPRWHSRLDLVRNRRWLVTDWNALSCLSRTRRHLAGAASITSLKNPAPSLSLTPDSSRRPARFSKPRRRSLKPDISHSSRPNIANSGPARGQSRGLPSIQCSFA